MADRAYFYFDNKSESGTFTVTSEATDYPKENVQDRDSKTVWKPGNGTNPQVWTLDCGAAITARASLIISSNSFSKSLGLKVMVDTGDNPAFPSPAYLVGSVGAYHNATAADQPLWHERFGSAPSKRYWRWKVDTGGDTDVEIAAICLWPEVDTERHPGGPWNLGFDDAATKLHRGAVMVGTTTRAPARQFGLSFMGITKAVKDNIEAGFLIARTGYLPFLYIDEYDDPRLVRFIAAPKANHRFGTTWNMTVQLGEDY